MSRADLLPENALIHELAMLEKELEDFAGRQPVSGASGIKSYQTVGPNTWDATNTVGNDSETNTFRVTTITVDYVGDGSQEFPIENIFASLFINGTGPSDTLTLRDNGLYQWNDNNGRLVTILRYNEVDPIYLFDPLRYRWIFRFESRMQITYYFKAFAAGSSPGTLSATAVTV